MSWEIWTMLAPTETILPLPPGLAGLLVLAR